ncbi:Ulp1 family isopeptidase [Candidatus Rickettsia kedanie]|uniref:Ubiquitin-like protease family profile domain-containing protein n=1 Tax=Candidatus Rickettsia kedanie TaxID=3115352 RepID=A0ABP9TV44_9RICK
MFTEEVNRTKFFSDTQILINDFVPLPEPQAKEWPKVQQNQNEQLTNEQKETNKQNDMQLQKQEEALIQPQQTQQQPTRNTPLHTIENIQESDYWYSEDDIKNILEANIDKNKFSTVTNVDLTSPDQLRDALREGVHEDLQNKGKVVLMPINTGHGYWVSMVITKDDNTNKIIFTYNDPLGRSLNDRPDLVAFITEVCSDAEIIDLKTPQQEEGNTSDCGVFVCDNLVRQSQGLEILSMEQCREQGLNLRKPQAETLKQSLIAQMKKMIIRRRIIVIIMKK